MRVLEIDRGSITFDHRERLKNIWRVDDPYRIRFKHDGLAYEIEVESGFLFDGASVPRPFWSVVPPHGEHTAAAVVHDKWYRTKGSCVVTNAAGAVVRLELSRKDVDKMFRESMYHLGVADWKVKTMYQAVRKLGPRW